MTAIDRTWIVYRHISPSNKVYIGITTNIKDRWNSNGRQYCTYGSIFKKAIEKYGWDNIQHEILLEGISKEEACYAERYLIKWYKLHNLSYNITDGGEGCLGRKDSEETVEKRRLSILGQKRTAEQIENIRKAHLSESALQSSRENIKIAQKAWKGRHHSEETRRKMSENAKGRDMSKAIEASRKAKKSGPKHAVLQIDLNNIIINEFSSVTEATNSFGKTSRAISNCLSGKTRTAFGYRWEYKNYRRVLN